MEAATIKVNATKTIIRPKLEAGWTLRWDVKSRLWQAHKDGELKMERKSHNGILVALEHVGAWIRKEEFPKLCGCGKTYTREQWARLQFAGIMFEQFEMRHCSCTSSLCVSLEAVAA